MVITLEDMIDKTGWFNKIISQGRSNTPILQFLSQNSLKISGKMIDFNPS